jgi:hypothetical protein
LRAFEYAYAPPEILAKDCKFISYFRKGVWQAMDMLRYKHRLLKFCDVEVSSWAVDTLKMAVYFDLFNTAWMTLRKLRTWKLIYKTEITDPVRRLRLDPNLAVVVK